MASPSSNPNTPSAATAPPFGMNKLFKPPTPSPTSSPNSNPNPYPPPSSYASPQPPFAVGAPPPGAFSYPPPTPPFQHHQHHFLLYPQDPLQRPPPMPYASPMPNTNPNPNLNAPNPGARLMALLGTSGPPHLESAVSMPPTSSMPLPEAPQMLHAVPSAPPMAPVPAPARKPSSKMPRGRHLGGGDRAVYDVDSRLPGESQPPQLEVTPITKYTSDPGLVLGRQIAVNRTYICYGLKLGAIRVLNINTALRSLLRGHTQRVTDMAFFAEDVHLLASASVDGRIYVWKINEGPDEEDKPQIAGNIVTAIQIVGDAESYHPRICWHSHKQEVLVVAIGNRVLKIDTTRVGRGKEFSAEEPLKCSIEKLIDGVQFIGKHDGEVTDLSISQWMATRLVSASKDGTVKIWDDRKTMPLVTLRPHDGQPVNSVAFLTAPHRPDHIVLITAGPLNREVKIWASASEEGWLLPSDSESWQCIQTLDLRSSSELRLEEAFFNQVVVLPRASLILLANAKKNAIYAVHVDYGQYPTATRMDYIADFTVAMPILSLTGTSDSFPDGEQLVQVYCVQTQAIQQYALDLSQCLPPPTDNVGLGKDSSIPRVADATNLEGFAVFEPGRGPMMSDLPAGNVSSKLSVPTSNSDSAPAAVHLVSSNASDIHGPDLPNLECKPSAPLLSTNVETAHAVSSPATLSVEQSGRLTPLSSPIKSFEQASSLNDHDIDRSTSDCSVDRSVETVVTNVSDVSSKDGLQKDGNGPTDITVVPNSHLVGKLGGNTTHLVTPSELLSGAVSSSESTSVTQAPKGEDLKIQEVILNNDVGSVQMEANAVGQSKASQHEELGSEKGAEVVPKEGAEISFNSPTADAKTEMARELCAVITESHSVEETQALNDVAVTEVLEQPSSTGEEEVPDNVKEMADKATESAMATASLSFSASKWKKQKAKQSQASPSSSPFNSVDSSDEPGNFANAPAIDTAFSQILSMQETLNQVVSMQKEMQKQMGAMVAVPITKEGKRVETALGRSMEKAVKANVDALWARFQEENAKHEKAERERTQQIISSITSYMNKDLPAMLEKTVKKEIPTIGQLVARSMTQGIEKTIFSAISDSFQRGVGDKAVNQLEKSVNSKLEATVARQIQAQFQTSGKQALQDALRSTMESSAIPAFELACKSMFDQVDAAFQKGMAEHTAAAQQQLESMHTPLAITLRDAISSASSITQNLTGELADGHRKLLALVASGNNKAINPMVVQQNGPLGGPQEMVEAPLDPMKELTRLISERKFEEAFTLALQRSDVTIVSWLCSQVDIHAICSMVPLPLNQGVLLALLQQLACDISNETSRKLGWMTDVAVAINPTDPMITVHVRPIFEQVYNILAHQRSLPTTTATEGSSIRLIMHVINSVLMSCK